MGKILDERENWDNSLKDHDVDYLVNAESSDESCGCTKRLFNFMVDSESEAVYSSSSRCVVGACHTDRHLSKAGVG